ncbi:ATP-binding protein [Evansella sp. AB-rgal1]|uniref:ATP-binding protein n=1 Tax=Evansella sp. AB-rgal1 TaxID=3242696 RepID=UPI00359EFDAC
MYKQICKYTILFFLIVLTYFLSSTIEVKGSESTSLSLHSETGQVDVYPTLFLLQDNNKNYEIHDVISDELADKFVHSTNVGQLGGFFETHTWLRFEVHNESNESEWLLEFAFQQIFELILYSEDASGLTKLQHTGSSFPFQTREINHRHFIFTIDIEPNETKVFYAFASGGGDLHPPITVWNNNSFMEKSQREFMLLGLFYGIVLVMILYNLFLFISLKMKSYFYYVIVILCTLLGKMAINGIAFQYIWPNYPQWNIISPPILVSVGCIFILLFTSSFLDTNQYLPLFQKLSYWLMGLNGIVLITVFFNYYFALNFMVLAAGSTFLSVLLAAFICLKRGARQARFFILGWLIFLVGVFITILERAAILPYTVFTEYAGQGALTVEVVLLSLALADKFNIIRKEKEQAEQNARESQTLAMKNLKKADELKDEFLAITSHELRTPLYGMIGIAESLRDGVVGDVSHNMKDQLSMIISSGNRLTTLVNDILDFSKLKHETLDLQKKAVNIKAVVDVVFVICKPLLKSREMKLINMIDHSLPFVYADPNRLQQIFYNLLGNAIKYTDEGKVVITGDIEGDFVKISVADTGKGIMKEQLDLIFEPFQQVDKSLSREVGGAGIGLSITKRLVDLHDGTIEVTSDKGIGSTFIVKLPIHHQEDEIEDTPYTFDSPIDTEIRFTKSETSSTKTATILIADDEPINLQVLVNQLKLEDYEIITVTNGSEVLELVRSNSVDLLILDIMMPSMSGYEVCEKLRQEYSLMELPILMLTAKNQLHDKLASFEVGANDYLVKPCDKQELISRVKTLVKIKTLNTELKEMNLHLEEKVLERTEELKIANEELTQMNNDLMNMVESRRRMLSNIAHELGTPVTLIYGYLQAVKEGIITANDEDYHQRVMDKVTILNRLIDDLSDLTLIEREKASINKKEMEVESWLNQIYQKFIFEVSQRGRQFECLGNVGELQSFYSYIDIGRMDQVFSNLISNAIKHTSKETGKVSLNIKVDTSLNHMILEVIDNGVGIREDNLPYIFERFYKGISLSSDVKRNGVGLGLAIVQEIVQGHDGEIWVESKVDKGSKFSISLPIFVR